MLRILILLVLSAATLRAESFQTLVYGHAGRRELKLDLSLPAAAGSTGKPPPLIVYIHGGGWRVGNKSDGKNYAALFTGAGYAFASIDHRSSASAIFPAQIFDCKTAVRFLRANARRYGFDARRIGVLGMSSGGHLAALLGTTEGVAALEDRAQGSPAESSRVRAVCMVSGPVDITYPTRSLIGRLSVKGLLGDSAEARPALARASNPANYVTRDDAAFLIIQGDRDELVIPAHGKLLADTLRAKRLEAALLTVHGAGHVPFEPAQQQAALAFFARHLGK